MNGNCLTVYGSPRYLVPYVMLYVTEWEPGHAKLPADRRFGDMSHCVRMVAYVGFSNGALIWANARH